MESKEPDSKVDIVKEVASALEEEEFTKVEAKNTIKVTPTKPSTNLPKKQPTITAQLPIIAPINLKKNVPTDSSKVLSSPSQEKMRSEAVTSQKGSTGASGEAPTTSASTWQDSSSTQSEDSGASMWGWMSSAVSAGFQTTQNIGRNIVEKTKVG